MSFIKPVTKEVELPMPVPLTRGIPVQLPTKVAPQPERVPVEEPGILVPNWPTRKPAPVEPEAK